MDKNTLAEHLKVVLATTFSLYLKSHNYHWNVTGRNFSQDHSFFGDLYSEIFDSIDEYAEHIRTLGVYTPGSLSRFSELSKIEDELAVPESKYMYVKLANDNKILLNELKLVANIAEELKEHGILNFIEGKIDDHEKIQWKLNAFKE